MIGTDRELNNNCIELTKPIDKIAHPLTCMLPALPIYVTPCAVICFYYHQKKYIIYSIDAHTSI